MNRRFNISYDVIDAYELWEIELTDEGEDAFNQELGDDPDWQAMNKWLAENPDLWEYFDLRDSGGSQITNLTLEDEV